MADLQITDIPYSEVYTLSAAASQAFSFTYLDEDDVQYWLDGVLQTSGYSIIGNAATQGGFNGGTMTFSPPTTGVVEIRRIPHRSRTANLLKFGVFDIDSFNQEIVQMMANIQHQTPQDYETGYFKDYDLFGAAHGDLYLNHALQMLYNSVSPQIQIININGLGEDIPIQYIRAANDTTLERLEAETPDSFAINIDLTKQTGNNDASYFNIELSWVDPATPTKRFVMKMHGWVTDNTAGAQQIDGFYEVFSEVK